MKDGPTEISTITTLRSLIRSLQDLESQLKGLKTELKAAETEDQKIRITAEINKLVESLDAHQKDHYSIPLKIFYESSLKVVEEMLNAELVRDGYGRDIIRLVVEFKEAGASSLDFEILADFSGKVAQYYNVLGRAMQRIAVDACNKYGWVIPFTQVTLHTAKDS